VLAIDDQGGKIVIDTAGGQKITLDKKGTSVSVSNTGGQSVTLDGKGTVTVSGPATVKLSATTVQLSATNVQIGANAVQSALLGTAFLALFNSHVHAVGQVPTTPPQPPIVPTAVLSQTVKIQS
jgi:hypothetical protein